LAAASEKEGSGSENFAKDFRHYSKFYSIVLSREQETEG